MLDFTDKPYRYFPPRYNRFWGWLLRAVNRRRYLPKVKRVVAVDVDVQRDLRPLTRRGDRLLFVPNHPSHADPQVFLEAASRIDVRPTIMAAYDVFLRSRLTAWSMQRLGCFSVDREGSDTQAMKEAGRTIMDGVSSLTIFPEGNVYLTNDLVTPFHEGAALMACRAAKQLVQRDQHVWLAPVSMKLSFTENVREAVDERLRETAAALEVSLDETSPAEQQVRAVGVAGLHRNLSQRGVDVPEVEELGGLIERAAEAVLAAVEQKAGVSPKAGASLVQRVRDLRRAVHQVRIDHHRAADHFAAATWADEAMLAWRILSYRPDYVASRPTLDRYAETVEKLAEDTFRKEMPPLGPRQAWARFGQPINVTDRLEAFGRGARQAMAALTAEAEAAVQQGVDAINAENTMPGGRLPSDL